MAEKAPNKKETLFDKTLKLGVGVLALAIGLDILFD